MVAATNAATHFVYAQNGRDGGGEGASSFRADIVAACDGDGDMDDTGAVFVDADVDIGGGVEKQLRLLPGGRHALLSPNYYLYFRQPHQWT